MKKTAEKLIWISQPLFFLSLVNLDLALRHVYWYVWASGIASNALWFSLLWCLFLTAFASLFPVSLRRVLIIAIALFYSVLVVVHAGMYSAFGQFFSFADLDYAGVGAAFFSWEYISIRKLLLLGIGVSLILAVSAAVLAKRPTRPKKTQGWIHVAAVLAIILSAFGIWKLHSSYQLEEDFFDWKRKYGKTADEIYVGFTDKNSAMMVAGLYQYTFRDFCRTKGIDLPTEGRTELDTFFDHRAEELAGPNEMTGLLEGKNLILILVESLDTWMLKEEYMPNLYALKQQGVCFENHYTPLFQDAGTFNTEIMVHTGFVTPNHGYNSSNYIYRNFPLTMEKQFKANGYFTDLFHAVGGWSYNRAAVYENWGMDGYHDGEEMGMWDTGSDSLMLLGYDRMTAQEPFFDFIITYSGHGPYVEYHLDAAREAVAKTGIASENPDTQSQYICAIAQMMETDAFIGGLVDRLEADGKLDDTVLIILGDHYAKYLTDMDFLRELKGVGEENPYDLYKTPFLIYAKDLPPATVEKYTSSIDVLPTVMNLFNLNPDRDLYRFFVGDDMFSEKGGAVMFPDYAWLGEEEAASSWKERIDMSMNALIYDYFRDWK